MIAVLQQARQLALREASGLFWGWSVSVVAMIWVGMYAAGGALVSFGPCMMLVVRRLGVVVGAVMWLGMHHYASRIQLLSETLAAQSDQAKVFDQPCSKLQGWCLVRHCHTVPMWRLL